MRGFFGALAAIAMLATGAVPAVAKPKASTGWTCQYSKGQIVMARALEVDPAPPRATPAAPAGSSLSGKAELVLQQTINTAGLPNRINGKDYFVASIRDNDGAIRPYFLKICQEIHINPQDLHAKNLEDFSALNLSKNIQILRYNEFENKRRGTPFTSSNL